MDKCTRPSICAKCGNSNHTELECKNPFNCINCTGEHPAYSRECLATRQSCQVANLHAVTRKTVLNWTPSIHWRSFPTSENRKPSVQHVQDNHITSGHMKRTSRPCYAQVTFFAFRRTRFRFWLTRKSLLLFLREQQSSHSLSLSLSFTYDK